MKLSDQALGAVMMALQKSLVEQSDIVPVLKDFELEDGDQGLVVTNPPVFKVEGFAEPDTTEAGPLSE